MAGCVLCRSTGKRGRGKCKACKGTGKAPDEPYGRCPVCGKIGTWREADEVDGNDGCAAGHIYPSRQAVTREG